MKRFIAVLMTAVTMFCGVSGVTAHAAKQEPQKQGMEIRIDPNGNWIKEGGYNRYNGVEATSREETEAMEQKLQNEGYIRINGADKQITDEQFEELILSEDYDWWFEDFIDEEDEYKAMYHVYVYKPSFDDWWEQHTKTMTYQSVEEYTKMELINSTVIISYAYWWAADRVGKDLSNEINDGIPSWCHRNYATIITPVDAEIHMILRSDNTYYTFYVTAGTPFRVILKYGAWSVVSINGVEVKYGDTDAPKRNNIQICENPDGTKTPDEDSEPTMLDFTKFVEANNIQSVDLSGKPDRSLDQNQNIPEKGKNIEKVLQEEKVFAAEKANIPLDTAEVETATLSEDTDSTKGEKGLNLFSIIFLSVLGTIIASLIIAYIYYKKKNDKQI